MSIGISSPGQIGRALLRAARAMLHVETPRDASSISYFSLIALFPSILVLIAVVDAFLGWLDLHDLVIDSIVALFPGSRSFLAVNLTEITAPSPALLLSCTFAALWLSTWIFIALENALNRAWHVRKRRTFWESRIRSIALMVLGGIMLLISAGAAAAVGALRWRATDRIPAFAQDQIINWIWSSVLLASGFLISIVVFYCIYKLMPDKKVLWPEAISAAVVAAALWQGASYLVVRLLPVFDPQKVYGRAGAFVALLIWVYTSSLIILFGANFAAQLHQPGREDRRPKTANASRTWAGQSGQTRIRAFPFKR